MANEVKLTRRKVLMIAAQTGDPVAPSADNAIPIYQDTAASYGDVGVNSRAELASNVLSNEADVMGLLASSLSARSELKGSGYLDVPPEIDVVLRCSMMKRRDLKRVEVTGTTAAIPRGATIVGGTSSAEGLLKIDLETDDDFATFEAVSGSFVDGETISEKTGSVNSLNGVETLKRVKVGAVIGGCLNVGDTLTGQTSGTIIRVARAIQNGVPYLYYSVESGTGVVDGEVLKVRAKSVVAKAAPEDAARIEVDKSSLVYVLRAGATITGGTSSETAVVQLTYTGDEDFVYLNSGAGALVATETLTATPASTTAQSDSQVGGYSYRPNSSRAETEVATITLYEDGYQKTTEKAQFSLSLEAEANGLPIISYTSLAPIVQDLTGDTDTEPAPVFDETRPAPFQCAGLRLRDEFQAFTPVVSSVSFDAGRNVSIRVNGNNCSGAEGSIVTAAQPTGSMSIEQVPEADYPLFSKFFSGQLSELKYKFGCQEGNSVHVYIDACQYAGIDTADNGGILNNTINLGAKKVPGTSGDNEFEFLFV